MPRRWLALRRACGPRSTRAERSFLEELTWTELRDAIRAGTTTVIVPVGGTEQNGPHMALGKHNVRVQARWPERSRARSATRWSRR